MLVVSESRILFDPPCKGLTRLMKNNILKSSQRHQRGVGYVSLGNRDVRVRAVKRHKIWSRCGAFEEGIHPPPIAIATLADIPFEVISEALSCNICRNRRELAFSPRFCIQEACDGKVQIPNDFSFHTLTVLPVEEPVVRVAAGILQPVS